MGWKDAPVVEEAAKGPAWAQAPLAEAKPDYSPAGGVLENIAAGAGKAMTDIYRGGKQILSNVPGINSPTFNPQTVQAEIDDARKRDAPLSGTVSGKVGEVVGTVGTALPAMVVPGAQGYLGATLTGAGMGALQPTSGDESRLLNTTIGAGAGAGGKYVGDKVAGAVASRLANAQTQGAQQAAQNAGRDAALTAGRAEGYVVPTRMIGNQGFLASLLEGFGGKVKLEQLASNKNQAVTNMLARRELGLAADDVLDGSVLQGLRQQASQAYQPISQLPQINSTPLFTQAVSDIEKRFTVMASKFPQLANKDVQALVDSMKQGSFTGNEAVEFVKQMRQAGNLNSSVANTVKNANAVRNLGLAQREAADAMDDLIAQNLQSMGQPKLFQDYVAARQLIAKTHTIENAMDNAGNVSARQLLKQLEGKPYGGDLKKAADFAGAFPKATQDVAKVEPYSVVDAGMMALLGTGGGLPAAAIPLARPAARSMVLSDLYQGMRATAPTYGPSTSLRIGDLIAQNPALRRLFPASVAAGAVEQLQ